MSEGDKGKKVETVDFAEIKKAIMRAAPLLPSLARSGDTLRALDFEKAVRSAAFAPVRMPVVDDLLRIHERHRASVEGMSASLTSGLLARREEILAGVKALARMNLEYRDLFRHSGIAETVDLAQKTLATPEFLNLAKAVHGLTLNASGLAATMNRVHGPWLLRDDAGRSVRAFTHLFAIGEGLRVVHPFDVGFTETLRRAIGDWRKQVEIPEHRLSDPVARVEVYVERGLDRSLTDFPADAFHELTDVVGLGVPNLLDLRGDETDDVAERAYRWLRHLERRMRLFVSILMEETFGSDWVHRHVPGDMRRRWEERRDKDVMGQDSVLIDYADFGDCLEIMKPRNCWEGAFKAHFVRKESVIESFARLNPVRNAVAHSRILGPEDLLFLVAEARRLLRTINAVLEARSIG